MLKNVMLVVVLVISSAIAVSMMMNVMGPQTALRVTIAVTPAMVALYLLCGWSMSQLDSAIYKDLTTYRSPGRKWAHFVQECLFVLCWTGLATYLFFALIYFFPALAFWWKLGAVLSWTSSVVAYSIATFAAVRSKKD